MAPDRDCGAPSTGVGTWPPAPDETSSQQTARDTHRTASGAPPPEEPPPRLRESCRTREAPSRPFQHLCAELFQHAGQHYLLAADPFSGWQFVRSLGRTATAAQLRQELRGIFCVAGAPEVLWSDGSPQLTSRALAAFFSDWRVKLRTSTRQSAGRAEAAFRHATRLILRVWDGSGTVNQDAWARGTLRYRNTPGPDGRSPAQIVLGVPARDMTPAHRRSFAPCWQRAADEADAAAADCCVAPRDHRDRSATYRQLQVGSRVALQDPATRRWDRLGVVAEVGPHRRYFVRLPSGRVLTRSARSLRQ